MNSPPTVAMTSASLLSPPRPSSLQPTPSFTRSRSTSGSGTGFNGVSGSTSTSTSIGTSGSSSISSTATSKRARSSSIVSVQEIPENYDDQLDQGALTNVNATWVNNKGAWLIHVVLILTGIVLLDIIPGMTQDLAWTIVNLGYLSVTYIVFHYVTGVPFDLTNNSGVYDRLTLWEQIDYGAQHTPAKKWLTTLPIVLFLASTHYTRYDSHPALFTLNLVSLVVIGLAPKLPVFHRLRFKFFDGGVTPGPPTPVEEAMHAGERDFASHLSAASARQRL